MPSTYSNIKIQLMATGENNTTWGNVTNINLGTALEEAIVGSADVTFASANVTLTLTDTNASQTARHMRLRCTGVTGGSTRNLVVPAIEKPYIVQNDCSDSILVKTAAGNGITVPAGKTMWVYSDGTNVVNTTTHLSSLTLGTDLAVADGGTGASTFTTNGVLLGNGTSVIQVTAVGATGQVLVGNTGAAPSWAALSGIGVTSLSFGSTGLTPATATTGAITVAGTLGVANGGTGTATAFTAGSVVFAGASGVYSQDNANFFWDDTNNRLGIGTATPTAPLTVSGSSVMSRFQTGSATDGRIEFAYNTTDIGYLNMASSSLLDLTARSGVALVLGAGGSERMRITAGGNIGIGSNNPATWRIYVSQTGSDLLNLYNSTGTGVQLTMADQGWQGGVNMTNGNLIFQSGGTTERMRIDATGNVGIGTSSPAVKLDVSGGGIRGQALDAIGSAALFSSAGGAALYYDGAGVGVLRAYSNSSGGAGAITFVASGSENMRINATGDVGIGTAAPTARLHVNSGTSTTAAIIESTGTSSFVGLRNSGGTAFVGSDSTGALLIQTPGSGFTTKVYVSSAGSVGVNTSSPASLFQVFAGQATITSPTASATSFANREDGLYFTRNDLPGIWRNKISNSWSGTPSNTTMNFELATGSSTNNTVMSLLADGNVGIGTSAPAYPLSVRRTSYGVTAQFLTEDGTGNPRLAIYGSSSGTTIQQTWASGASNLIFANGGAVGSGTEAMRIDSSGNLGIGTSSPGTKLDVTGTTRSGNFRVNAGGSVTGAGMWGIDTILAFNTGSTERMRIDSSGNVGIGTATPPLKFVVSNAGAAGLEIDPTAVASAPVIQSYNRSGAAYTQLSYSALQHVFQISGTERMRITSAGDVAIGSTIARGNLSIGTSLSTATTQTFQMGYTAGDFYGWRFAATNTPSSTAAGTFNIQRGDSTAWINDITINDSGNVGIGTPAPQTKFEVLSALDGVYNANVLISSAVSTAKLAFNPSGASSSGIGNVGGGLVFYANGANTERMRIDSSGNVGVNCTPSPWPSSWRAIDITTGGGALFGSLAISGISNNAYLDSGVDWRYKSSFGAAQIYMNSSGVTTFYNAAAGTAGNVISFVESMTITAAGSVGIGTSSVNSKLLVTYSNPVTVPAAGAGGHCTAFGTVGYGLATGALTNGNAYLQATRWDALATNYDLLLQPNGGNVGIGTSTPGSLLDINGGNMSLSRTNTAGSLTGITVTNAGTSSAYAGININSGPVSAQLFNDAAGNAVVAGTILRTTTDHPLVFGTNGSERARIDSSGNFLWNKTSLTNETTVDGVILYKNSSGGGSTLYTTNGGTGTALAVSVQADAQAVAFFRSGTLVGSISVTSTSTAYNTSSDARLKENITNADSASVLIDAIKVRQFDWKADGSHQRYGMIAQELQEVVPEAVNQPADPDEMMGVDYSKLVPLLLKEIQSLRARVAQLEERK
jgi:hypothetical protein